MEIYWSCSAVASTLPHRWNRIVLIHRKQPRYGPKRANQERSVPTNHHGPVRGNLALFGIFSHGVACLLTLAYRAFLPSSCRPYPHRCTTVYFEVHVCGQYTPLYTFSGSGTA
jgi:hypothetical protein